jgi:lysophospholipase L1-like esterase
MSDETPVADHNQERPKSKGRSPVRQIAIGLSLFIITTVLFLAALELIGTFWERNFSQGPLGWTLVASRRLDLERHGTEEQPYHLFEPEKAYNWEGIDVVINSRGFRNSEFDVPKPENTFRILNLGDSIAFGWEVAEADTYGKVLEAALNDQGSGITYEVLNAGIPTWNLEAERNFFLQEGLGYDPDLLIIDLTLVNDITGQGPNVSEEVSLHQWLRDNTHGWSFLTTQMNFLRARQQGPEAFDVLNPPKEVGKYFPADEDSPSYDRVWGYLAEIVEAAQSNNIPVIMVAFPTAFQLNSQNHPDVPQRVFGALAADEGVPFVDLLPIYGEVCAEAEVNACEGYENLLFADVWMHPNAFGHELAARALLPVIETLIEN